MFDKYTLVVVDMQPVFPNSRYCVNQVAKVVTKAIQDQAPIVLLEWEKYENGSDLESDYETLPEIKEQLEFYDRSIVKDKCENDGSPQVVAAVKEFGFCRDNFLVCGVNTCYCVNATTRGIKRRLPKSNVGFIKDAVSCDHGTLWSCRLNFSNFVEKDGIFLLRK